MAVWSSDPAPVLSASGDAPKITPAFETDKPWTLKYATQSEIKLRLFHSDGRLAATIVDSSLRQGRGTGTGSDDFESGSFYIEVIANVPWSLQVVQKKGEFPLTRLFR